MPKRRAKVEPAVPHIISIEEFEERFGAGHPMTSLFEAAILKATARVFEIPFELMFPGFPEVPEDA